MLEVRLVVAVVVSVRGTIGSSNKVVVSVRGVVGSSHRVAIEKLVVRVT